MAFGRGAILLLSISVLVGCGGDDDDSSTCDPLAETSHADSSVIWLQCPLGTCWDGATCVGEAQTAVWNDAIAACPSGFRVPTRDEFGELLECEESSTSCDECGLSVPCATMFWPDHEFFCDADSNRAYYTATEVGDDTDRVFTAHLASGDIGFSEKDQLHGVRCVR
jgi:hypothetical protein